MGREGKLGGGGWADIGLIKGKKFNTEKLQYLMVYTKSRSKTVAFPERNSTSGFEQGLVCPR
jgi:hypothetical protein